MGGVLWLALCGAFDGCSVLALVFYGWCSMAAALRCLWWLRVSHFCPVALRKTSMVGALGCFCCWRFPRSCPGDLRVLPYDASDGCDARVFPVVLHGWCPLTLLMKLARV
eukprot:8417575-Pyramimonas_sp.AAC.1